MRLVRRETVTTEHYSQAERERQEAASGGISGKAVLGTLLGGIRIVARAPPAASFASSPKPSVNIAWKWELVAASISR